MYVQLKLARVELVPFPGFFPNELFCFGKRDWGCTDRLVFVNRRR